MDLSEIFRAGYYDGLWYQHIFENARTLENRLHKTKSFKS